MRVGREGSATGKGSQRWLLAVAAGTLAITFGVGGAEAGALDTSFGSGGKVLTHFGGGDSGANGVAIQPDGKIVAAGSSGVPHGYGHEFALVRYTKKGRLDTRFGSGGRVLTGFGGGDGGAKAVAIQRDGKIVAAGESIRGNSVFAREFALVRYTKNGRLDTSFGSGGKVLTRFGSSRDDAVSANAVAIQPDGKIVAAGSSGGAFVLVRYTKKGRLDTSFGSGGKVLTFLGSGGGANAVAIQADGKIVAAGSSGDTAEGGPFGALLRYTKKGRLDTSFGSGGEVLTFLGSGGGANAVAIQPDGKIVAAGSSDNDLGYNDFALVRLRENGSADTSFGSGGTVLTGVGAHIDTGANAVAIQPDRKIVSAGGGYLKGYGLEFALVRYTESGILDTSFGLAGKVFTRVRAGSDDYANAIAIQPDGKIIVTGESVGESIRGNAVLAVVRYMGD